jgi:hypothetical protein
VAAALEEAIESRNLLKLIGRFYDAQDLLDELYASLADCSTSRLLKRLGRLQSLVIDKVDEARAGEWLLPAHRPALQPGLDHLMSVARLSQRVRASRAESPQRSQLVKYWRRLRSRRW